MASLLVPLLYVFIVFGGLWVFSTLYKRHISKKVIEPYFPRHRERDIYVSLLQKTDPPAPEHLLKAALVRRAVTNVSRIMRLREDKPAMQNLLQKGSIGDDLWNSMLAAEKELEAEVLETAAEANTFVDGWGQIIYQTATEVLHNEKLKALLDSIESMKAEKEQKYGVKAKLNLVAVPSPSPAPRSPMPPPALPAQTGSTTPSTPVAKADGLPSSSSTGAGSVVSSDGEASGSMSPSTPRTPKSAKKGKKRK
ncbi:preprotein translocase subunit Sec66 domain-containing protein [Phanerochaete sordida]|uniref:Preprotein translocase subunit Sec66 domain-containing protein n=1 Tax=Phanerochaete sordida TaxID=48140 RepID=A0A9P3G7S0_9APHY|nr:preprotein translocase subunit Sec66 domain-containing protein [Phanerochaete sordida]